MDASGLTARNIARGQRTREPVLSQYYEDGRGSLPALSRGAKIVADYQLPRTAFATDVKRSPEFAKLVARIRQEGFDPEFRRHVHEFNLKHPDSFRTLTAEEARVTGGD